MGSTTPLLDRIAAAEAERTAADRRFLERRAPARDTRARWLREGRAGRDLTGYIRGAFVPRGEEPGA